MKGSNIMVCVTQQKNSERLILTGAELKKNEDDKIFVIHVVTENQSFLNQDNDGEALEYLFRVSQNVGADLTVLRSKDAFDAMLEFAIENDITDIVIGKSPEKNKESLPDRMERELDFIEFTKL